MSNVPVWSHPYPSPGENRNTRSLPQLHQMPRRSSEASTMSYSQSGLFSMRPGMDSSSPNLSGPAMGESSTMGGAHTNSPNSGSGGSGSPVDDAPFEMQDLSWTQTPSLHETYQTTIDSTGNMPQHIHSSSESSAIASYLYPTYPTPSTMYDTPQIARLPILPTPPAHHSHYSHLPSPYPTSRPSNRSSGGSPEPSYDQPVASFSRRGRPSGMNLGDDEVSRLRRKVRELELVNESARMRVRELEGELANDINFSPRRATETPGGLPTPITASLSGLPQPTPDFMASWTARTEARIRLYCSLNRAGNALCSWHDSRRERRAFPPRLAPPGTLNCGCTYDEALFEETLSRHGVGSYRPGGDTVRMDPALRNPLLRLLQTRYNYRDGDFERDPVTGGWIGDEGPALWEQRAQAGLASTRRRGSGEDRNC